MTKRKDSGVELPSTSRETSKQPSQKRKFEVSSAKLVVLKGASLPFRLKGDPKSIGVETDNEELFQDYAKEQWMGTVLRKGMFLFDKFVIPDYAFQVVEVEPEESVITHETVVRLESDIFAQTSSRHRITLNDVIGHDSVKKKCRLVLRYLQDPSQFGEWAPRAVLFHGPPGTGKTMTATALANEGEARIFLAKASDLIGIHVGDGGRRISAVFEEARKQAPSIIFVDELDAIGLSRSFQAIRGDVSEVVTALLGELDRTGDESGVVVVGATNAVQMIDPAIRSRFDTVFEFPLPSSEERMKILELYAQKLPIPLNVRLELIVAKTEGLSGRDLRDRVLKEALHEAISEDLDCIEESIILPIIAKLETKDYTVDYAV
ncbi:MAG: AAA family ATPase [Candidatus Thorarchaeota archaeon]